MPSFPRMRRSRGPTFRPSRDRQPTADAVKANNKAHVERMGGAGRAPRQGALRARCAAAALTRPRSRLGGLGTASAQCVDAWWLPSDEATNHRGCSIRWGLSAMGVGLSQPATFSSPSRSRPPSTSSRSFVMRRSYSSGSRHRTPVIRPPTQRAGRVNSPAQLLRRSIQSS